MPIRASSAPWTNTPFRVPSLAPTSPPTADRAHRRLILPGRAVGPTTPASAVREPEQQVLDDLHQRRMDPVLPTGDVVRALPEGHRLHEWLDEVRGLRAED